MNSNWSYPGRELESMAFAVNYHRWILDTFRPFLGKKIVEVGAGSGSFSELLLGTDPDWLEAIEPSANMFSLLAAHFDRLGRHGTGRARHGTLAAHAESIRGSGTPDSILYINVLEHVEDDAGELSLMRSLLVPGGHALIFVPANPWLMGSMDRELGHYRRYTMSGLQERCRAAGFAIRFASHFDIAGIVPWWVKYCLLKSRTIEPGAVKIYDRFVVPVSRAIESRVPPPIGKNILIAATAI